MRDLSADELLAILRSAATPTPDPRLDALVEFLRRRWLALVAQRRPAWTDEAEDAAQAALLDLLQPRTLDTLRDPARVQQFATALFWNKLRTRGRSRRRELARRADADEPTARFARLMASAAPTPEDLVSARERLAIVRDCLAGLELAQAKFFDEVPDRDLAARFAKSHDAVRNHLKRVRQMLRLRLAEDG